MRRTRRQAFTLLEATFSIVLAGGLVVASLQTVGASAVARQAMSEAATGKMIAASLMAEILRLPYEDSSGATLGLEALEVTLNRLGLDDVDDYRDWTVSPLTYRDGTAIPGTTGWSCVVSVLRVNPNDISLESLTETGVKRIDISVRRGGMEVTNVSAIKTGNPASAPLINALLGTI